MYVNQLHDDSGSNRWGTWRQISQTNVKGTDSSVDLTTRSSYTTTKPGYLHLGSSDGAITCRVIFPGGNFFWCGASSAIDQTDSFYLPAGVQIDIGFRGGGECRFIPINY